MLRRDPRSSDAGVRPAVDTGKLSLINCTHEVDPPTVGELYESRGNTPPAALDNVLGTHRDAVRQTLNSAHEDPS